MEDHRARHAYRTGAGIALATAFVQVWINLAVGIIGSSDNPANQGFYGVVATAASCAFVARLRPAGMARAMAATAAVQALLGAAVATAPSTATDPMGAGGVALLTAAFVTAWLAAGLAFWRSARAGERSASEEKLSRG